jgi:phosphohistidine phosphatase SixA
MRTIRTRGDLAALAIALAALVLSGPAAADPEELVDALQAGGLVIVMRHAQAPEEPPDAAVANPDNPDRERQLDATGRETAAAMGDAIRALAIPVGSVRASTTYRARETALSLGFGEPEIVEELGASASMSGAPPDMAALGAWLRARTAEPPQAGGNVLLITHSNYIEAGFGVPMAEVASGEAFVFRPEGGQGVLLGRIRIEDWPGLAAGE